MAWGVNAFGQTNVPSGLSNVLDVAAGLRHSLALRKDGTIVAWGDNTLGETNVPAGLSNVVAIAAGGDAQTGSPRSFSLALKSDNTVVAWGGGEVVLNGFGGLSNVFAIGNGKNHALAIRTGPRTPVITPTPTDQYQLVGGSVTFTGKGVGLYGVGYQWKTNGVNLAGATNTTLTVTNLQPAQDGMVINLAVSNEVSVAVSTNAHIRLVAPPTVVSQAPMPTNQAGIFQTNLTLSVTASAPGQFNGFPLGYQWRFNGNNIAGANSTNYTVFVEPASVGAYSVVVSNVVGMTTSLVWQVTISTYAGTWMADGTLAHHLSTNAVARTNGISNIPAAMALLSGWTPALYSVTNGNMHLLTNAVWSTNFWLKGAAGLSATAAGISNGTAGQTLLTMVSPRHYLRATHTQTPAGLIAFLDTNNVFHWRTSIQQVTIGSDMDVGILDNDLPSSVGYLPVIPTNYSTYLPTNAASHIQAVGMNQDMLVFGQPMSFVSPLTVSWNVAHKAPLGLETNWNVLIRGGDSSDPERLLINNQLVLVTQHFQFSDGPNIAYQFVAINQQMHYLSTNNAVGTDYQLTPFSFTNWPSIH